MSMRVGFENLKTCAISNSFFFYLMFVVQDIMSLLVSPIPFRECCYAS